MRVEEKRKVVNDYCMSLFCSQCLLSCTKTAWCNRNSIATCDEAALDEAIKLINDEKVKGEFKEEPKEEPKEDVVNHPSHYTNGGMECIDEMILIFGKHAVMNFCLCNVWKYRKRALHKNGQEDLDKADWYMKKYKELKEQVGYKPPILTGSLEGTRYGA